MSWFDWSSSIYIKSSQPLGGAISRIDTKSNDKREQIKYYCASYNVEQANWEKDCKTVYDTSINKFHNSVVLYIIIQVP